MKQLVKYLLNNKCNECKILPTHYKYTIHKLVLISLEYCDKRGIDNINIMVYKVY